MISSDSEALRDEESRHAFEKIIALSPPLKASAPGLALLELLQIS